ncbi:MAG: S9 family peptidase [Candidatus Acidiferrales bacterium]
MIRLLAPRGFLALIGFAATLSAQEKSVPLTPEGSLNLRSISDPQFSPNGNRLAFVVAEPPKGGERTRHIWILEKKTNALRQFTFSQKSESSPRWAPDGRQLAFLSNRAEDQQQIYVMRVDGGEAAALTRGKRNIQSFEWSPDGKQIAFLAPDAKTETEEKKEKDKDDAHVVDKDDKQARLWVLKVAPGEARALTPANWRVSELSWAPGGERIFVVATDTPASDQLTDRIFAVGVSDGATKQLSAPRGPFGRLQAAPDGKTLGYIGSREDGPEPHDLFLQPLAGGAARNLTGASLDRPIYNYKWLKEGGVFAVTAAGFHNMFVAYTADGTRKGPGTLDANPGPFALSTSGQIAFVGQTATEPEEIWLWDGQGAPKKISHLNDSWRQYALSKPEIYKYKSFDDTEIEAALLKPAGYDGKSKLPLIALIHGGPTGNWDDSIDTWAQLLAARGYAVLMPNIRGSSGYGQKFIESNRGDWGGGDFKDVMWGIQDLEDRGIADPNRLGIGGWSYGGYMAEWAVTQTNVFKAAVCGAGLSNLVSEYGSEEGPSYDEWFYGVPYEPDKLAGFLNSSPFVHLKSAKTPTLILQGEADTTDPLGQSQELYRGLKRYGVETEFVIYPREPHGPHEEKHMLDILNRLLAWYDKHLKPSEQSEGRLPVTKNN